MEENYTSVPIKRGDVRSFTPDFISERRGFDVSNELKVQSSTEKIKEILQKSKEYLKGTKGYN